MARRAAETETPPPPQPPPHQMWGGRFTLGPSEALDALNRSLPVDHRLWPLDVTASKAWVHALGRVGVLTSAEESHLLEGLDRVAERLADGAAVGAPDEDVHTLVERLLYEEVGAVAGKLHTGRSRNDSHDLGKPGDGGVIERARPVQHVAKPGRALAAGGALAAGFARVEVEQGANHVADGDGVVERDQSSRARIDAPAGQKRLVEIARRHDGARGAAHHHAL